MDKKNLMDANTINSIFGISYEGENATIKGLGDITYPQVDFLSFLKNEKYLPILTKGNIFFLPEGLRKKVNGYLEKDSQLSQKKFCLFYSKNFTKDFISLLDYFNPYKKYLKTPAAILDRDFKTNHKWVANDLSFGPFVSVGVDLKVGSGSSFMGNNYIGHGVEIGSNVILHPGVVLKDGTVVGDNTVIHSNTVIGSDGFGYEPDHDDPTKLMKIPQIGIVEIGSGVEIGSNTSIDRATITKTKIGNNVKIDNLVQIAHNVVIEDNAIIVSQTGVAGSSRIGKGVILAGQVGISDHVEVGDGAILGPQSGAVAHSKVPPGATLIGSPLMEMKKFFRMNLFLRKLYENKNKPK